MADWGTPYHVTAFTTLTAILSHVPVPRRQSHPPHAGRHLRSHRGKRVRLGVRAGHGRRPGAGSIGVRARPHPGRVSSAAAARVRGSPRPRDALRAWAREHLVYAAYVHVPARRVVPPHRQHVVSVGLREQRRRLDGTAALSGLLSALWPGGGGRADRAQPGQPDSDGRRFRRHQRRHGRVRPALPQGSGPHARGAGRLHHPHRRAGVPDARLLVPDPARRAAPARSGPIRGASPSGLTSAGSGRARCS